MPRDGSAQEAKKAAGLTGTQQEAATSTTILTPRHEAFCQHFVLSSNATGAAVAAGYAPGSARNQGYRLMQQSDIRGRIGCIRRSLARAYCLDAEVLLGKLEAIYQRANENHNFSAAARAVEIQSRIARQSGTQPAAKMQMTTNDDKLRPQASGFAANSIPCAVSGGQK